MTQAAVTLESLGFKIGPKEPSTRWIDGKSILTGIPKCGKTSLLAQGEKSTFFFRMASEFNNLQTFGEDCRSYDEVSRWVGKMKQAHSAGVFEWDTLVFDPADRLLTFFSDKVCEKLGGDSLWEIPHGKGWQGYKAIIESFVYELESLPAHKFFVFHSVNKNYPETGEEHAKNPKVYTKEVVDLSEKTEGAFLRWVDNVFHIKVGYVGNQYARTILTRGTKFVDAGTKSPLLQAHPQINFESTDKATYEKLRRLFT